MNQTKIFAHRGFSSNYPENTMVAFQAAEQSQADGIEFDVQLSLDDVPVVIHDATLDRTTNGTGFVQSYPVHKIKKLDAGSWFHEKFEGESVPTLEEVLVWAKGNQLILNIELKGQLSDRDKAITVIYPMIKEHDLEDRVILSSFDHTVVAQCEQFAPMLETAVIVLSALYQPESYLRTVQTLGYHFYYPTLLDKEVESLIKKGIRLRPYTVNDEKQIKRFIELGCDGIITDDPQKAVALRNQL
ncbi:glycerophosphoryl diester phosphodiesterase [Halalkalibacter wakoensis JCM 9140]|uniref:Glycerophosphoryl diester phosphodiesterase n=1 Tax=Halalkalibacter wakoensis JCM 9140 TaxID=1236970 RepID=W4Q1D2_9BACI|nr:glycerophosphodiester phosphodiesterase [Halalkalibacter wakoensis]GAE25765.1 glycerophosphoryl diester phosphodiesterase [Halalkalibacter wakoensis JCM 9140]